jgi:hypothetical protein
MVDDFVDSAHRMHLLGGIGPAEEEDLPSELLAHLLGQIRAAITTVEAADVGIGLLEPRMLTAGQRQITCRVQAVPPPAAHPLTRQITTLGMNRISRCTSKMCSRPARAVSTVSAVSPEAY